MKSHQWLLIVLGWAALVGISVVLSTAGAYGVVLFAFLPLVMGVLTDWTMPAETTRRALVHGAATGAIGCLFFMLIGIEGLICIAMSLPLAVPLGMMGSWLAYKARVRAPRGRSRTAPHWSKPTMPCTSSASVRNWTTSAPWIEK